MADHAKRFIRRQVCFSELELEQLRGEAAAAGVTVAALIRDRALAGCPCRARHAAPGDDQAATGEER